MNMNESITGITLTKVCNIKPFKGATDSKQVTLAVKYDGLTIGDIFTKALRSDVISWQNGPGRKGYDNLIDKSTVNVSAKAPGAVTVDPETAMVALLMTKTPEEQIVYLKELAAKAAGVATDEQKDYSTKLDAKDVNAFMGLSSKHTVEPTITVKKVESEPTGTSAEIMEEVAEMENN